MSSQSPRILYTGSFRFPEKDAAAVRVHLVSECFKKAGFNVELLSWAEGSPEEQHEYQGFKYRCMAEFRTGSVNIFFRLFNFLFLGKKTVFWLLRNRRVLKEIKILVAYNPPVLFSLAVYLLSRIYKFRLILDSTEWYESSHLIGGKYGIAAIENWVRMRCAYRLFQNVIAISDFLSRYYTEVFKAFTIKVPAMCESISGESKRRASLGPVNLLYAGNAGKKDRLEEVIRCLPYWNKYSSKHVRLDIYGMEDSDFQKLVLNAKLHDSNEFITVHGKVPRSEIFAAYKSADFSVLFRENKRYALAGFPTKAVESWAAGVPVLTNAIGDLKRYCAVNNSVVLDLDNIKTGFLAILDEYDLSLSNQFREGSIETAQKEFSIESNFDNIFQFINAVDRC